MHDNLKKMDNDSNTTSHITDAVERHQTRAVIKTETAFGSLPFVMTWAASNQYAIERCSRHRSCNIANNVHQLTLPHIRTIRTIGYLHCQETLIYPELPVVYDRQLRGEIVNFFKAAVVIINCRHPQFFRYYGDLKHQNLLHRSNFPVLIALARKLKFETKAKIANQFQAPTNIDPGVVDYLAKLHNLL
ncbi:hypothetical protein KIW84_022002 [Lathyrus oleraceus]|uniref:Uncharacterized protein n=1 Tax=Pisum sativum TaxID=3888 RepID=A0A9D4YAM0_PEA|nr:hypothetical protein KIW84_022002 [Pisum sativum]